jgi:hypothetical protein
MRNTDGYWRQSSVVHQHPHTSKITGMNTRQRNSLVYADPRYMDGGHVS